MNVRSPQPYPEVTVRSKNLVYAKAILSNVGGRRSEMSAVSQYLYGSFVAAAPDIGAILHKISVVEMHHLDLFARLACQLGADPRLWSWQHNRHVYWTPSYNQYTTDLRRILHIALSDELAAIQKYERQAQEIDNENIVEILQRVLLDERLHAQLLEGLLSQIQSV